MLTDATLNQILRRLPGLAIGVLGDLFLDRYLDLDARLTEPSLETGLDAYQVVRVRSYPGAAGTVINNLVALGVRQWGDFEPANGKTTVFESNRDGAVDLANLACVGAIAGHAKAYAVPPGEMPAGAQIAGLYRE